VGTCRYAAGPKAFLAKLPGISSKNIRKVMDTVPSLHALANYSVPEMEALLGPADGKKLYDFFRNRGGI
jgi:ERCC4-type nuclease